MAGHGGHVSSDKRKQKAAASQLAWKKNSGLSMPSGEGGGGSVSKPATGVTMSRLQRRERA